MLAFATEFPVAMNATGGAFLQAVRDWVLDSPHTILLPADLVDIGKSDDWSSPPGPEQFSVLSPADACDDAAAALYSRYYDELEWTTTIAFRRRETGPWVALRLTCESSKPQTRLPAAKKPVLVRILMQQLGAGSDSILEVQHTPHFLDDHDIDRAADLLNGTSGCHLPMVYVSAGFNGAPVVDPRSIAQELAGMAHVIVEPNRAFSQRLRISVGGNNVYGGTVGIYWPDASGRRAFFLGSELRSRQEITDAVCREVLEALVNRRPLEDCTWASVQAMVARQRVETLKASGSQEVQAYIDNFENELKAARAKNSEAEREVARLKAELRRVQIGVNQTGQFSVSVGEQDFYEGEVLQILRDAVADTRDRVQHDSRRQHVLDAFLEAFPSSGTAGEYRDRLKRALREYTSLDSKIRKELEGIGFSVSEDGKHYKLVFQGDDRYTFTLPKSGSDVRGGLNAASDIGKRLF